MPRTRACAHVQTGHFNSLHYDKGSPGATPSVDQPVDGEEAPTAPRTANADALKAMTNAVVAWAKEEPAWLREAA